MTDEDSNSKLPLDLSSNDEGTLPLKKRLRLDTSDGEVDNYAKIKNNDSGHQLTSFKGFRLVSVLRESTETKTIFLEAEVEGRYTFSDGVNSKESTPSKAVVILEKEAFGKENSKSMLDGSTELRNILTNDVYGTYIGLPDPLLNSVKVTVIHPATEKHLEKYSEKKFSYVSETPVIYNNIVKPYLSESNALSHEWVFNILEHKKESERVIFEDKTDDIGFLLLPDMKWNGKDSDTLYVLALPFRRDIASLRDLTGDHLPLLRNIKTKTLAIIKEKFNVSEDEIRSYTHYQPSYYHFHVHFNLIKMSIPGTSVERAHLLDTVINNIHLLPDYYQKVSLNYCLQEDSNLLRKIQESEKIVI